MVNSGKQQLAPRQPYYSSFRKQITGLVVACILSGRPVSSSRFLVLRTLISQSCRDLNFAPLFCHHLNDFIFAILGNLVLPLCITPTHLFGDKRKRKSLILVPKARVWLSKTPNLRKLQGRVLLLFLAVRFNVLKTSNRFLATVSDIHETSF